MNKNCREKIIAFSDNNKIKFNSPYCEEHLFVVPPEELVSKFGKNNTIIVASSAFDKIRSQLISYGFDEGSIYLFNFAFMNLEYTDKEFVYDHMDDFERVYSRLADTKSKEIYKHILNYKITKDEKYLISMQKYVDDEHYQYFDNGLIEFRDDEVFLDIGAYTGDTYKVFSELYSKYNKYIAFEADCRVYEVLKETVEKGKDNIILYNYAAWDKEDNLYFEENPGSTRVGAELTEIDNIVKGIRLDDLIDGEKVSFVKMDIEGAEYNALLGMEHLIKNNRPILAICVYHLRDDYYKITDYIETLVPGKYKYFFRQYRYTPTETVCYAIPSNRTKAYSND